MMKRPMKPSVSGSNGTHWEWLLTEIVAALAVLVLGTSTIQAQGPSMLDPNLGVRTTVGGLTTPISMAFLDRDDFFVVEKTTGQVKRVVQGEMRATVLDLPVNFASERGLLGIALHPRFPENPGVYLYWTESSTGADSGNLAEVGNPNSPFPPGTPQPLGNRVDRFIWNRAAQTLTFDRNLIRLHAFQNDATNGRMAGNHNGGVIRFGTDDDGQDDDHGRGRALEHNRDTGQAQSKGRDHDRDEARAKLYIIIGDNGRRGLLQNLPFGPFGPGIPDDQFGGPLPDNNHLTGVVLRLNDDGSTPRDNPFYTAGSSLGGEVGANIQKIFAYGIRNSFGMAFDPRTGDLWESENADDAFDEINRIQSGHNGGWIQIMGPVARVAQFKAIETMPQFFGLQQVRWSPVNIADTPAEALSRLFMIPGAHYQDPEFSWKFAVAPAGIGFMTGRGLGPQYDGDLFVGASRPTLAGGYLFRFRLTGNRRSLALDDSRLADRVADNPGKFTIDESESLLIGQNFGVGTDIHTGPNGNLFVVSLTNGAVYEVFRIPPPRPSRGRR